MRIDTDEVKSRLPISQLVEMLDDVEWDRRLSRPAREDWWACCPFHPEATPSFHADNRKGLWHCFGCRQGGDAIAYLMLRDGLAFRPALERLAALAGMTLRPDAPRRTRPERDAARSAGADARRCGRPVNWIPHAFGDPLRDAWRAGWRQADRDLAEAAARAEARGGLRRAAEIWRESRQDLPVLRNYLAARGVLVDVLDRIWRHGVPPSIRCHPALPYYDSDADGRLREVHRGPAMIGLIASPEFHFGAQSLEAGIHRTWITPEGRAMIGGRRLAKRWLGLTGHMEPVPIRITAHSNRMIVGEGIETVLAAWSTLMADYLAGNRGFWAAEVAKSRGAIAGGEDEDAPRVLDGQGRRLPGIEPDWDRPRWLAPDYVDELVILAEGSSRPGDATRPPGSVDAHRTYRRALIRHSRRRDGRPRICRLALPGGRWDRDLDFADLAAAELVP